ncbi:MAG: hypothetical protein H7A21_15425 [Spirochaetales bacterium]|nr:hypothetical protein [Spirochaetales bacterium]
MDPTLSKADAHRVFGDLYRKDRPPDLQEKVDQIVQSTSDVFVRIQRIEELDRRESGGGRLDPSDIRDDSKRRKRRGGPATGRGRAGPGGATGTTAAPKRTVKRKERKPGLFARLFGSELTRWGEQTGTLDTGFLGMNAKLSSDVPKLFEIFTDDQIAATMRSLKVAAGTAWESLDAARYNTVIAGYQLLNEFVKGGSVFRRKENPNEWITELIKLQKYYALLLQYPNWQKTLTEDLPEYLESVEKTKGDVPMVRKVMSGLADLDKRQPGLKNSIIAVYALAREKILSWEEIEKELRIGKPALDAYRAPEQVMEVIVKKIGGLKKKYEQCVREAREVEDVRSRYFETDSGGKLKTDFLNPILEDSVRRIYGEGVQGSVIAGFKREPIKLLYALLKDFEHTCIYLFSGAIGTYIEGGHQTEEIALFRPGLFKKHVESFNVVLREIEPFFKKYKDSSYEFGDFVRDMKQEPEDAVAKAFLQLVRGSNKMFAKFNYDLATVINNHRMALRLEEAGKAGDSLKAAAKSAIESLEIGPRFIPYYKREIASANRQSGKKIADALEEIVRNCYNFLYIFRDAELTKMLSAGPRLQQEAEGYKEQLARLGSKVEAPAA